MRFEVPQFIDIEDKIFGPLTFKQFIYLVGGAGLAYTSYRLIPFPLWIPITGGCIILGLLLAFYKINNRPFIQIAQSYISFKLKGKIYLWKRDARKSQPLPRVEPVVPKNVSKEVTMDRIKSLAQNLDILDSYEQ